MLNDAMRTMSQRILIRELHKIPGGEDSGKAEQQDVGPSSLGVMWDNDEMIFRSLLLFRSL